MNERIRTVVIDFPTVGLIAKKNVCRIIGCSERTLPEWKKQGIFTLEPVISGPGKPSMYSASQLRAWIEERELNPINLPIDNLTKNKSAEAV